MKTSKQIELLRFAANLLKKTETEVRKAGLPYKAHDLPYVDAGEGIFCSGFFLDELGLHFAIHKPVSQWVNTLAHEYCHFKQWKEKSSVWSSSQILDNKGDVVDSTTIIDNWLNGQDTAEELLDRAFKAAIEVELDCERRTVALFKKMGAPIDIKEYAQRANAYILFYHECRRRRAWYNPKSPPYEVEAVWSQMPKSFSGNYYSEKTIAKLPNYDECFLKK